MESQELTPRQHLGRGDPYEACIDFLEGGDLEAFSVAEKPYDLLIYCPYLYPAHVELSQEQLAGFERELRNFTATRKLVVVRSPNGRWARYLEDRFSSGIGLSAQAPVTASSQSDGGVLFVVVPQVLDLAQAVALSRALRAVAATKQAMRDDLNEIRGLLRRLLVSLDPEQQDSIETPLSAAKRLTILARAIGLEKYAAAWTAIVQIEDELSREVPRSKLGKLQELVCERPSEIWATKELDRSVLNDFKERNRLDFTIRLTNSRNAPGAREARSRVVLSRIDREVDLDAVAYLRPGDVVVMSSWEAAIRAGQAMSSWERSERWRERAKRAGITIRDSADPVLDLANFLDAELSRTLREQRVTEPSIGGNSAWWDDGESLNATVAERSDLLGDESAVTRARCFELLLEGGYGMFVEHNDELQTIRATGSASEITAVPAYKLRKGSAIILFRDAERTSFFDLMMEQLENSPQYAEDAHRVRFWKDALRAHVVSRELEIGTIGKRLAAAGKHVDDVTIRSWVFGATMAPLKEAHLALLIRTLGMTIDSAALFESVEKLRNVARLLGKALNQLILSKNAEQIDDRVRDTLRDAGVDTDELSNAVETRIVEGISEAQIDVPSHQTKRLFRLGQ